MHAVDRCDFCESDAVGTFETVPADLEPTDAEQRRLLLCEGCQHRLEGILEPFVARLRDGAGSTAPSEKVVSTVNREGATGSSDRSDVAPEPTENERSADDGDERPDPSGTGNGGADASERKPEGYGVVIRLLRNRAEPMERAAVEDLAGSAYELEPREVDAVIGHAIEQGELLEENGRLHRP